MKLHKSFFLYYQILYSNIAPSRNIYHEINIHSIQSSRYSTMVQWNSIYINLPEQGERSLHATKVSTIFRPINGMTHARFKNI